MALLCYVCYFMTSNHTCSSLTYHCQTKKSLLHTYKIDDRQKEVNISGALDLCGRIWGRERCVFVCVSMETMVPSGHRRSYHEPGKDLGWREISKHYNKQENLDTII